MTRHTTIVKPDKAVKRGATFEGGRSRVFGPMARANGHMSQAQNELAGLLTALREDDPARYALVNEAFDLLERARRNLDRASR